MKLIDGRVAAVEISESTKQTKQITDSKARTEPGKPQVPMFYSILLVLCIYSKLLPSFFLFFAFGRVSYFMLIWETLKKEPKK